MSQENERLKELARQRQHRYYYRHQAKVQENARISYAQHPEERREKSRKYRKEHPAETKAYNRRWYTEHREQRRIYNAAWHVKNAPTRKISKARYVAAHPELNRASVKRHRARIKNAPINDLTAQQWETIKAAYQYRCVYCPETCWRCQRRKHALTQDHVIPLSRGGSHTFQNIVPACKSCNCRKYVGEPPVPIQQLLF
jgi:hypothetical protein